MKKLIGTTLTFGFLVSFMTISSASSYVMHTVKEGNTYWNISQQYNQDVDSIMALNQTTNPSLEVGDIIKVKAFDRDIAITINGTKLSPDSSPYLEDSRTFVPVRFIAEALNADVSWNATTKTAIITRGDQVIELPVSSTKAYVNGLSYTVDAPINIYNNRVYVPVRFVAEVFESSVNWDAANLTVIIQTKDGQPVTPPQTSASYTADDLYWLSRIVSAESEGESYAGKLAVANVIINRKNSSEYPNTIKGVIFDSRFGVQFTPVSNGTLYKSPTADSIKAAKEALEGNNNIGACLFFVNISKTTKTWIQTNRTFYTQIGNHAFYL